MNLDYTQLEKALACHTLPQRAEVKRRLAKDVRADNRNRPNKVRKAMKVNGCTLGGTLPNRHNDSGRHKISWTEVDEVMAGLISDDPEYSIY